MKFATRYLCHSGAEHWSHIFATDRAAAELAARSRGLREEVMQLWPDDWDARPLPSELIDRVCDGPGDRIACMHGVIFLAYLAESAGVIRSPLADDGLVHDAVHALQGAYDDDGLRLVLDRVRIVEGLVPGFLRA